MTTPKTVRAGTTPQSCYDGYALLQSRDFNKAIKAITRCLGKRSLDAENKAIAYHNRATAYYYQGLATLDADVNNQRGKEIYGYYENEKLIPGYFDKALEDIEKSIKIDPTNAADGYCLRGHIWLEISWGDVGWDDLEKGLIMGADEENCKT